MTDTFSVEQKSIDKIRVSGQSVPVGLPGVEEELDLRIDGVQFVCKLNERLPLVLLADQVETNDKVWVIFPQLRHYVHIIIHLCGVNCSRRRVYEFDTDEVGMVSRKPVLRPFITSARVRKTRLPFFLARTAQIT